MGYDGAASGNMICVLEVTEALTTGTTAAAIAQTPTPTTGTGASGSMTFAAAADSQNRGIVCYVHEANEATAPDGSWAELDDGNYGGPVTGFEVQWSNTAFFTASTASCTTSSIWACLGVEVRIAGGRDFVGSIPF